MRIRSGEVYAILNPVLESVEPDSDIRMGEFSCMLSALATDKWLCSAIHLVLSRQDNSLS